MEWDLQKGENANLLFQDFIEKRLDAPEYLRRPSILPGLESWYDAFWELSTSRVYFDGGCGPIPATAIRYPMDVSPLERQHFLDVIRAMDRIWIEDFNEEVKAQLSGHPRRKLPTKVYTK